MTRVNGIITEDVRVKAIKESPIEIGAWIKILQEDGKECSGLICNYASLEYCYLHEDKLEKGALVEITGVKIPREYCDFMIVDEEVGIRILN
jgi:hypothetical protein